MEEIIFLVEEDEIDGGYNARSLNHPIFTQGDLFSRKCLAQRHLCEDK